MLKLISLEMRKMKTKLFRGALLAGAIILAFMILVIFTDSGDGEFNTYADVIGAVFTFSKGTFLIFAAVLLGKIVIGEYKNNTISVLFMYPIPRKKLMTAKLLIVCLFTFTAVFVSDVVISAILIGIDYFFKDVIQGELTFKFVSEKLLWGFNDSVYAAGIGLIPIYFGMRKKSVSTTIVSAIIMTSLLSSGFGDFRLGSQAAVSVGLALVGVAIAYLTIRNIEYKDIA